MLVYNTQTHKKEEFKPIDEGKIRMYVCGPTVYDQIHIGNARTFLSFDVIRRYLMHKGYEVTFAQNLTDVDDKIIQRAIEQGRTAQEVSEEFSQAFIEQNNPDYVLILSGDQLYRMDYGEMLACHKKNNADLTIAVMPVPWEEASRFGIMSIDDEDRITKFSE